MKELFATICLAGAIQSLFLFLVLLIKKNNRIANIYLSFYMFFVAIDMIELYLTIKGFIFQRPYQLSLIPYSFIFGPSMFLYISFLTAKINTFTKKCFLLYAPFVIFLLINIILYILISKSELPQAVIIMNIIINGGGLFFEGIFYILSLIILYKYINRLKEFFSDIDAIKLSFIRTMLIVLIFVILSIFLSFISGYNRQEYKILDVIAILIGLGLVFGIAFFAVLQPKSLNKIYLIDNALSHEDKISKPRYEKFRLPEIKEKEIVKQLIQYMSEKKPYIDENLTLQSLANQLTLSTHHLSMILNIHFNQNFYNFINSYRIDEVKQKLVNPNYNDYNILTIAFNSGFNSKSTFNTMFKKFTGISPKEYRANILPRN